MAGMLLCGSRPIYAAIYQFVVLAMIFAACGFTALVSTLLVRTNVFTAAEQVAAAPWRGRHSFERVTRALFRGYQ